MRYAPFLIVVVVVWLAGIFTFFVDGPLNLTVMPHSARLVIIILELMPSLSSDFSHLSRSKWVVVKASFTSLLVLASLRCLPLG